MKALSFLNLMPYFFEFVFLFWPPHMACGILVLQPGLEPEPLAVKVQGPNHWTTREFPNLVIFFFLLLGPLISF